MWVITTCLQFLLLTTYVLAFVASPEDRGNHIKLDKNKTVSEDATQSTHTIAHGHEKPEELCLRMHNNTAFMGVEPFARLRLYSASDCRKNCLEAYPKCVGVMFYYVHRGDKNKKHICYLFDKNSVNEEVALVPEKPSSPLDMVQALEIVVNCHEFDPFPPLDVQFAMSTDKVPLKKRDVGFDRPVRSIGPWTPWSNCFPKTRYQIRSQPCEYGRYVQRRRCLFHPRISDATVIGASQPVAASIHITVPYPPIPYIHPSIETDEYARIMAHHMEQVQNSCCYRQQYVHQQLQQQYPAVGAAAGQQVNYAMPAVPACLRPCGPFGGISSVGWQQTVGTGVSGQVLTPPSSYQPVSQQTLPSLHPQTVYQPESQRLRPDEPRHDAVQPYYPVPSQPEYPLAPQPSYSKEPSLEPSHRPQRPKPSGERRPSRPRPTPTHPPEPVWTTWSEWSQCSETCDIGSQQRYRKCETITQDQCAGEAVEWRRCEDIRPCQTWAPWSEWSTCRASCGTGERSRSRYCHLGNGHCDGSDYEVESCITRPCVEWSQWEEWSSCSTTCGQGVRRRLRSCEGGHCPGDHFEEGICEQEPCSHWANWQEWSYCSISCGPGTKSRQRVCIGSYCEGESFEHSQCVVQDQCPTWTEWEPWSQCSVTCGYGTQTRTRTCLGPFCPGQKMEEVQCERGPCSIWSPWGEWSQCSSSCGSGIQTRSRACVHGEDCQGESEESQHCTGTMMCAQWAAWGSWSACDKDCGPGRMTRRRDCISTEGHASDTCQGHSSEESSCNAQACCKWTLWSDWSGCDRNCGGGRKTRTRMCQRPGLGEYATCHCPGHDREQLPCNQEDCPQPSPEAEPERPIVEPELPETPIPVQPTYQPVPTIPVHQPVLVHPGYQPPPVVIPGVHISPGTVVVPGTSRPSVSPGLSCQWSEWCGWSGYDSGVTRRSRTCLGDYGCTCYGVAVEEAVCPSSCGADVSCTASCKKK